jgi:hypothetical protein
MIQVLREITTAIVDNVNLIEYKMGKLKLQDGVPMERLYGWEYESLYPETDAAEY